MDVGYRWCSQAGVHTRCSSFLSQALCLQSGCRHSDPSQPEVGPATRQWARLLWSRFLLPPAPTRLQQTQRPQLAPTDHPLAEMSPHLDPFYITTGPDLLHSLHGLLPTPVRDPPTLQYTPPLQAETDGGTFNGDSRSPQERKSGYWKLQGRRCKAGTRPPPLGFSSP